MEYYSLVKKKNKERITDTFNSVAGSPKHAK